MKKPIVKFDSCGSSGNIFHILGECSVALRKERRINDFNELRDRVQSAKSYADALVEIRRYIDLVDISEVD